MKQPTYTVALRPYQGGLSCVACQDQLPQFIELVLQNGRFASDDPIVQHLEQCAHCVHQFLQLVPLLTTEQMTTLQTAWIIQSEELEDLTGFLQLCQLQLGFYKRLQMPQQLAITISLIGLLRRHQRNVKEAMAVHELALEMADSSPSLLSQLLSYTDLAFIALEEGEEGETAVNHLQQALPCAVALRDQANEARIHYLFGQAWALQERWAAARLAFEEAERVGTAVGYTTLVSTARKAKEQSTTRTPLLVEQTMASITEQVLSLFNVTWIRGKMMRSEEAFAHGTLKLASVLGKETKQWVGLSEEMWQQNQVLVSAQMEITKESELHMKVAITVTSSNTNPVENVKIKFCDVYGVVMETGMTNAKGQIIFTSNEAERFTQYGESALEVGFCLKIGQGREVAGWQILLGSTTDDN